MIIDPIDYNGSFSACRFLMNRSVFRDSQIYLLNDSTDRNCIKRDVAVGGINPSQLAGN